MLHDFVVLSNRGKYQIDWKHPEAIKTLIRERKTRGRTFAEISRNSIEIFSIPVGASALTKAYHRHVEGNRPVRRNNIVSSDLTGLGYILDNYREKVGGATIVIGDVNIILPT